MDLRLQNTFIQRNTNGQHVYEKILSVTIISEIKSKPQWDINSYLFEGYIKKTSIGAGVEKLEPLCNVGENVQRGNCYEKQ